MTEKKIKIEGTGVYLPKAISSDELETKHGIPNGWSLRYSGVANRHHVTDESNGFMGARAAEDALKAASVHLDDIDMLISAGGSYDYPLPNQASMVKHHLKKGDEYDFPAIDIDSTCLSFVTALDMASRLLDGQTYKRILIVSTEIASKGLNPLNWETLTLFGDGAAAVVVSYDAMSNSKTIKGQHKTFSEGAFHSIIEGGGVVNPGDEKPYDKALYSFKMNGKKLLRLAKAKINPFMTSFFSDLDYSLEDIDLIIPHQASLAGLKLFNSMLPNNTEVANSLTNHGN